MRGPLRTAVVSRQPRGARWRPRGRKPGRERAARPPRPGKAPRAVPPARKAVPIALARSLWHRAGAAREPHALLQAFSLGGTLPSSLFLGPCVAPAPLAAPRWPPAPYGAARRDDRRAERPAQEPPSDRSCEKDRFSHHPSRPARPGHAPEAPQGVSGANAQQQTQGPAGNRRAFAFVWRLAPWAWPDARRKTQDDRPGRGLSVMSLRYSAAAETRSCTPQARARRKSVGSVGCRPFLSWAM